MQISDEMVDAAAEAYWLQVYGRHRKSQKWPDDVYGRSEELFRDGCRAALIAAEKALKVTVEVKPLEWRTFCSRSGNCEAKTPLGEYVLQFEGLGFAALWMLYLPYQYDHDGKGYPTIEAAKAAAQSDYEQRIRSALVTPTDAGKVERVAGPSRADIEHAVSSSTLEHAERRPDGTVVNGNIIAGLQTLLGMTLWSPPLPTPEASPAPVEQVAGWQPMSTAPTNGKHCILAIYAGGFVYSIQGAFMQGKWMNAADREGEVLAWMPNVLLPEEMCPWTDAFKARALAAPEGPADAN